MRNRIRGMLLFTLLPTVLMAGAACLPDEKGAEGKEFKHQGRTYATQKDFAVKLGRRCGTPPPSVATRQRIHRLTAAFRQKNAGWRVTVKDVTIPVYFHVIHDGEDGKVGEDRINKQLEMLNTVYKPHGFIFTKGDLNYKDSASYYTMGYGSAEERAAKTELGADAKRGLNFYTGNLQDGLLGWATFPWDLAGDPVKDGVVILHSTLPGGQAPYDQGKTAVHEVGHWLGLYHTFQGGCSDPDGDFVDDTPAHNDPTYGTPAPDTVKGCKAGEFAPIHNYMNYVNDAWMTEFTKGQVDRAHAQVAQFRTLLFPSATRAKLKK